jgi:cytochrome c-type biogenesis protein
MAVVSELVRLALLAVPAGLIGFLAAPCCGLLGPVYLPFALNTTATNDAAGGTRTRAASPAAPAGPAPIRALPLAGQLAAPVSAPTRPATSTPTRPSKPLRSYLAFTLGFCTFFTLLGVSASTLGIFLLNQLPILLQAAGIFLLVLGVAMVLRLRIALPGSNRCLDTTRLRGGIFSSFGMGLAIAVTWTPCTGPTLGAILALAATTSTAWQGGALLLLYAIGLSLPFGLMALALTKGQRLRAFQQRHQAVLERTGGALMIAVGVAILVGGWQRWLGPLTTWLSSRGWPPI